MKSTACLKLAEPFRLLDFSYAHRGLWNKNGPTENSHGAYHAAANAKVGLEMDVRPSKDGVPMCFHDDTLDRMTDHNGLFASKTAEDLTKIALLDGTPIPRLSELLAYWPAELPILIEMKIDGNTDPKIFTHRVSKEVNTYPGSAAIISFSESAVSHIPKSIMRGQLVPPIEKVGNAEFQRRYAAALDSDVDFLAMHVSHATVSKGAKLDTVCWTVRTETDRQTVKACGHAEIFEHLPVSLAAR